MARQSNTALLSALALVAVGTIVGGVLVAQPSSKAWWTDGRDIRASRDTAPIRHILWQPARPVNAAGTTPAPAPADALPPETGTVDEYERRLSADGTTMIFVRRRAGTNADLFSCRLTPQGWSEPAPLGAINTENDELGPELAADGKALYFYSDRPGGLGGFDLWMSRAGDDGWSEPRNLGPAVNSRWNEYGPALTPDGVSLYFSSNRPRPGEPPVLDDAWSATLRERRQRHDYDLFRSDASGDEPAPAEALSVLNTPADEGAPALSPVGDFLYFASDRDGGRGGFDLYRSRLAPVAGSKGTTTIAPENLGEAVNSGANELDPGLSTDGFRLYFSSDRRATASSSTPNAAAGTPGSDVAGASDGANTPATAAESAGLPPRYSLWQSGSREVYEEVERVSQKARLLDLWNDLWPWLLLLLLTLAPLILLARLLRSEVWRKRLGRLSLLAQCVLVSVLIHAIIASTLAVWKVGQGVIGALREGGGTRVTLASSGISGEVSGQIFGDAGGGEPTPLAELTSFAADFAVAPLEAATTETSLPPLLVATPVASVEPSALAPERISPAGESSAPERTDPAVNAATPAPAARSAAAEVGPEFPQSVPRVEPAAPGASIAVPTTQLQAPATRDASVERLAVEMAASESEQRSMASPAASAAPEAVAVPRGDQAGGNVALPDAAPAARVEEDSGTGTVGAPDAAPAAPIAAGGDFRAPTIDLPAAPRTAGTLAGSLPTEAASGGTSGVTPSTSSNPPTPLAARPAAALPSAALPSAPRGAAAGRESDAASNAALLAGAAPGTAAPIAAAGAPMAGPAVIAPPRSNSPGADLLALPTAGGAGERASASPGPALTPSAAPGPATKLSAAIPSGSGDARATNASRRSGEPSTDPTLGVLARRPGSPIATPTPGGPASPGTIANLPAPASGPTPGVLSGLSGVGRPESAASTPSATPAPSTLGRLATRADPGGSRLPAPLPEPAGGEGPTGPVQPAETFAQRAPEVRSEVLERMGGSEQTEKAVGLALEWFARHQSEDGRWTGRGFDAHCEKCGSPAEFDADAAMTGIVLQCYLGAGHTHRKEGPYRERVAKAIRWLVNRQTPSGDLRRGETMYGQTVAAVALCEALAMTGDPELVVPARRAVNFVVTTARQRNARTSAQDTSVLGWLIMTMESARRAGLDVPRDMFEAAERWLDLVGAPGAPGRYSYRAGEAPSAAMTAEAMFVRQLLGHRRTEPRMEQSAEFILRTPPRWGENAPTYHWYYATLALFEHQGDAWKQWNEAMVRALVDHQKTEGPAAGSWDPQDQWSRMGGRIYQTAVCTLSLEVYYRYKPR